MEIVPLRKRDVAVWLVVALVLGMIYGFTLPASTSKASRIEITDGIGTVKARIVARKDGKAGIEVQDANGKTLGRVP